MGKHIGDHIVSLVRMKQFANKTHDDTPYLNIGSFKSELDVADWVLDPNPNEQHSRERERHESRDGLMVVIGWLID